MSFAALLRKQSEQFNTKKDNTAQYSDAELTDVLLQASIVCDSCAARGIYRCKFTPYLSNRIEHPISEEFIRRMKADGIKATSQFDGTYVLDWSTEEPNIDYSNIPHHTSRGGVVPPPAPQLKGTDSDEDVDDKKKQ